MSTLKELRSEVYQLVGDAERRHLPPALVDKFVNEGAKEYARRTGRLSRWMPISFTANTETASLPSVNRDVLRNAFDENGNVVYLVSIEELLRFKNGVDRLRSGSRVIARDDEDLRIYPVYGETTDVTVFVQFDPNPLNDDADELHSKIDENAVIAWALFKALGGKLGRPQEAIAQHQLFREAVREGMARREREGDEGGMAQGVYF